MSVFKTVIENLVYGDFSIYVNYTQQDVHIETIKHRYLHVHCTKQYVHVECILKYIQKLQSYPK